MTLEYIFETGSGVMSARLVIEGLAVQFVSDPLMERSAALDGAIVKVSDDANLWPGPPFWTPDLGAIASSGFTDPIGGDEAWRIEDDSSSTVGAITDAVSYTPGHELWVSFWLRREPESPQSVTVALHAGTSAHTVTVFLNSGFALASGGTVNELSSRLFETATGDQWHYIAFRCPGDGAAVAAWLRVMPSPGLGTGRNACVIYGPRIADRDVNPDTANPHNGQGRERVYCFNLTGESPIGLVIDETVNVPEALLETPGTSIRLNEREDEILAQVFFWKPDVERWVDQTVEVADTTVHLLGTDGVQPMDVVHLGTEAMLVTEVSGSVLTVERGYWQTIPQKHWSNEGTIAMRTLHNRPMRIRGRRCYLYLYGDADNPQGEGGNGGEPVWIGHVSGEPSCDDAGTIYRLQLASNAERLKGKLGGELGAPVTPRGIYYSWQAPLSVIITEGGHVRINTRLTNNVPGSPSRHFTGFFETQEEFCDGFNAWLAGAWESAPTHSYRAVVTPDGGWTIEVKLNGTGNDISMRLWSAIDGGIRGNTGAGVGLYGYPLVDRDGTPVTVANGAIGYATVGIFDPPPGAGLVPRGFFGRLPDRAPFRHGDQGVPMPAARATAPELRMYARVPADCDVVQIEWPHGYTTDYNIDARDEAEGWIKLSHGYVGLDSGGHGELGSFYNANLIIRPLRSLAVGTLEDLRAGLVANGPEYCNLLGNPFLTDADLASWADVVADVRSDRSWLQRRIYQLFISIDLEDLLQHEMRLYGVFPIIDHTGKIGIQSLARVTGGANKDATPITVDDELITVGWSSRRRGQQTVNMIELKTGYDVREDEHVGRSIFTQDMPAFALDHEERSLTIEPRSRAFIGDENIDPEDAADQVKQISDVFGYPHDFVTVHVPWTHFRLRLGDPVRFSADHLPDFRTGRRPTRNARGIVVGRRWQLGEVHGTLTLLLHGLLTKGYAPTARITASAYSGDRVWKLIVDNALYAPSGAEAASFFEVGYKIRIVEYDTETPMIVTGKVVNRPSADRIDVELDVSLAYALAVTGTANLLPAPGAETWSTSVNVVRTTGQADPVGGTNAVHLDEVSPGTAFSSVTAVPYTSGNSLWASIFVKKQTSPGAFAAVALSYDSGSPRKYVYMKLDEAAAQPGTNAGSITDLHVADLGEWLFLSFRDHGESASTVRIEVFPAYGSTYPTPDGAATGAVIVYGPRIADATVDADAADPSRAWLPGSATHELCFDSYDRVTDEQKEYSFISLGGVLDGDNADVFSP